MNIIITGGAGFIGSNLARTIQETQPDAKLLIVDDFRTGSFANLSSEGEHGWSYRGHVIARSLDELDLYELIDVYQPDVIFHEASITDTTETDQAKMIRDNVEPFDILLETTIEAGIKLVWASSAATYGIEADGATRDKRSFRLNDAGMPANVYGFSKWLMENRHRRYQAISPGAHLVGLRYFNVFGPGEQSKGKMASMIYQLAVQMRSGRRPRIFHDGEQARDQIYVKDVVSATLAAADDTATPGIYNVGTGSATTFNQIVQSLNEALGLNHEPEYFDNPYDFYQDFTCADIAETTRCLKWSPAFSTHQGILDYASWLKDCAG